MCFKASWSQMRKISGLFPDQGQIWVYRMVSGFISLCRGSGSNSFAALWFHWLVIIIWELAIQHLPVKKQNQLLLFKRLRSDHLWIKKMTHPYLADEKEREGERWYVSHECLPGSVGLIHCEKQTQCVSGLWLSNEEFLPQFLIGENWLSSCPQDCTDWCLNLLSYPRSKLFRHRRSCLFHINTDKSLSNNKP